MGQSRVTSSLHTASSANFQPVERLRGGEAATPSFFSATAAFSRAHPGPPTGFCEFSGSATSLATVPISPRIRCKNNKMHIKSRSSGTRIQSAIFTKRVSLLLHSRTLGKIKFNKVFFFYYYFKKENKRTRPTPYRLSSEFQVIFVLKT